MNNLSLYNITNRFVELMDKAENGELTEEEYNELGQELAIQLQEKGSNIIGYAKNIELTINAMKDEEVRISTNRKLLESKLEKFKQYVKDNMEKLGITKMDTELGTLSVAKNPLSVEIESEEMIPNEFKLQVVSTKIDKTAIKNHVAGTKIVDDKTNLRIK